MRFVVPTLPWIWIGLWVGLGVTASPARSQDKLDPNDPLVRALQKLQQEIDDLRREIDSPTPLKSAMPVPANARDPAMTPQAPETKEPKTKSSKAPETEVSGAPRRRSQTMAPTLITRANSEHWSFQPIQAPAFPAIRNTNWPRDDLDRFVLARIESQQRTPPADADRETLLRRVSYDLTGLPPTVAEIQQFVSDPASLDEAFARVVDRKLQSPRFGERWGRHWLDVVRYADSVGRNWNAPFTYAWRYRDYVIDSINQDKPFDKFIIEQLAGDLLPAADVNRRREQLTATGFLALGAMDIIEPEGESLMMDRIDEQIDVTSRAFLGLTIACARCHDHKYEPVSMRDYYALAGVFYSTETKSGQRRGNYVADDDLILLPSQDGLNTRVPGVHSMADMNREHRAGGWREVLWTTDPNLAMAAIEGDARDCPIRIDGEAYRRGTAPPRGDFRIAGLSGLSKIDSDRSGRLALGRWIASPDNPLTARVAANRVWQHLFGRGLVETVDNFGESGAAPGPFERVLLDHLAARFRADWSLKSLVRSIVTSRTYRLQCASTPDALRRPRRLELEAVRDSMLLLAGQLQYERPTGIQVAGRGGKGRWGETRSLLSIHSPYRTVYLPVLRSLLPEMYSTFDFPNPTQVKGQREVTTVAPQSLFLMNSEFSNRIARAAADRILRERATDTDRIRLAYLRVLGRNPDGSEIEAAQQFLSNLDLPGEQVRSMESRWAALLQALMICGEFRTLL